MNLLPEHLDYKFTQILFIGEKSVIKGAELINELEKLEDEDEARVNHLKGSPFSTATIVDKQERMLFLRI